MFDIFSTSQFDPNSIGVFIKHVISNGKQMYHLTSNEEFLVIDDEGSIQYQEMVRLDRADGINPLGRIPYVVVRQKSFRLVPIQDRDIYSVSLAFPRQYADLAYALQYQSHGMLYSIDVDVTKPEFGPDIWMNLKSTQKEGNTAPQIGCIQPNVDVEKGITFSQSEVANLLASRGIQPGVVGTPTGSSPQQVQSGISKIIDEADNTAYIKKQQSLMVQAEEELWDLIAYLHNNEWSYSPKSVAPDSQFSQDFDVMIDFPLPQPYLSEQEKIDILKLKLDNKLISKKRAFRELYPKMSDEDIAALIKEIDEELKPEIKIDELDKTIPT